MKKLFVLAIVAIAALVSVTSGTGVKKASSDDDAFRSSGEAALRGGEFGESLDLAEAGSSGESGSEPVVGVEVTTNKVDPIEYFTYSIDGDSVVLESYKGHDSVLELLPSYEIEGVEYKTDLSKLELKVNTIETIIFADGIEEINTFIFNSSKAKSVFFPKSMTLVYDYSLAFLHPDDGELINIYYAGTQDDWADIFTEYVRKSFSEMGSLSELGTVVSDKINDAVGTHYDSSLFAYYFSASVEDLG